MDRYKFLDKLGDGSFGTVYKATHLETGSVVAIKKIKRQFVTWEECLELSEVDVLRKLQHPALITLREVVRENENLYLVFEFMGSNIYQVMRDAKRHFPESTLRQWLRNVLLGLAHLHAHNYIHRDIKPENLLVRDGCIKIADFGLARKVPSDPPFTEYVSTRWYRAPEVLLRAPVYGPAIDIFAVGAVAAELFSLEPIFPGANEIDQLACLTKVMGAPKYEDWPEGYVLAESVGLSFPPTASSSNGSSSSPWYSRQRAEAAIAAHMPRAPISIVQLIAACCAWNPEHRPTAQEALNHPFFQVDDDDVTKPSAAAHRSHHQLKVKLKEAANRFASHLQQASTLTTAAAAHRAVGNNDKVVGSHHPVSVTTYSPTTTATVSKRKAERLKEQSGRRVNYAGAPSAAEPTTTTGTTTEVKKKNSAETTKSVYLGNGVRKAKPVRSLQRAVQSP